MSPGSMIKDAAITLTKGLGVYFIYEYFRLKDYFQVKWAGKRYETHRYDDHLIFWKDALGPYFKESDRFNERKIMPGDRVCLEDFYLVDWFPRSPGTFFNRASPLEPYSIVNDPNDIISFSEGMGVIRFRPHKASDGNVYKLITAVPSSTSLEGTPVVEAGIPVIMNKRTYDHISRKIKRYHILQCTLEGIYNSLPKSVGFSEFDVGVEPNAIFINSPLLVKGVHEGGRVKGRAWTLVKHSADNILPVYETFRIDSEDDLIRATDGINKNVSLENEQYELLTDFDEEIRRFRARFNPTDIVENSEAIRQVFHEFNTSILNKMPSLLEELHRVQVIMSSADREKIVDLRNRFGFQYYKEIILVDESLKPTGNVAVNGTVKLKYIPEFEKLPFIKKLNSSTLSFLLEKPPQKRVFYLDDDTELTGIYIGRKWDSINGRWKLGFNIDEGYLEIDGERVVGTSLITEMGKPCEWDITI